MRHVLSVAVLTCLLAACGQSERTTARTPTDGSIVSTYAERPELQDPESQAILHRYANDPGLLQALQEAYGERPVTMTFPQAPALTGQDLALDRLAYIKRVGWGTVSHYNAQYASYAGTSMPYAGLNWTRDGCSAPEWTGLGYREDFRPACNVHDFAYRNLKVYQRTDANRKTSDDVFYTNLKGICAAKPWYAEPACFSAAYAYYQGVRAGGSSSF